MMATIKYPKKPTEAEVQSYLYHELLERGFDARLQVPAYNPETDKRSFKLDLVVFVANEPRCIVECKSWSCHDGQDPTLNPRRYKTKQLAKYRDAFGLPIQICGTMDSIPAVVEWVESEIHGRGWNGGIATWIERTLNRMLA